MTNKGKDIDIFLGKSKDIGSFTVCAEDPAMHIFPTLTSSELDLALSVKTLLANKGNIYAQFDLALFYEDPMNLHKEYQNYELAKQYFSLGLNNTAKEALPIKNTMRQYANTFMQFKYQPWFFTKKIGMWTVCKEDSDVRIYGTLTRLQIDQALCIKTT